MSQDQKLGEKLDTAELIHETLMKRLASATPPPEVVAAAKEALKALPVPTLSSKELAEVTALLNMLRILDSQNVLTIQLVMEYMIDDGHAEVTRVVIGDTRRLACLKVLFDEVHFRTLKTHLAQMFTELREEARRG